MLKSFFERQDVALRHQSLHQSLLGLLFLVAVFGVSRLIPHPPNLTALGGVLVWSTAYAGSRRLALLGLWLSLLVTDLFFGFYSQMIWVYLTLAGLLVLGHAMQPLRSRARLIQFAMLQSFIFFLTTNFAVWATTPWYSQDLSGLLQAYVMALPFYGYQILGDLIYIPLIGLAYAASQKRFINHQQSTPSI